MSKEKDEQVLRVAEEYVINLYTTFTRSTTEHWGFDETDLDKMSFNDSPDKQDGYLIAAIASSRIVSHEGEGTDEEEWEIGVVVNVGFDLDEEFWRVYQGINGEWIVEQA